MKLKLSTLFIYALMGMLTLGYTMIARLGLSIFNTLYDPKQMSELPMVTKLTAALPVVEIWQVMAWISLAICLLWGIWRSRKRIASEPCLLPWTCHVSWILLSFFWNAVGALVPFVSVVYVIK
jgi:hypothetical protein